jgi:hypothetical protein
MESSRTITPVPWKLTEAEYRALVVSAGSMAATVGMVVRESPDRFGVAGRAFLGEVRPHLEESVMVSHWPGTHSSSPTRVEYYRTEPGVLQAIVKYTGSFWEWMAPDMPEDLHFLRGDRTVVLGSTVCERYAWLELDRDERARLAVPAALLLRLGRFDPLDEIAAWVEAYREDLTWAGKLEFNDGTSSGAASSAIRVVAGDRSAELIITGGGEVVTSFTVARTPETLQETVSNSAQLQSVMASFLDRLSAALA